MVDVGHPPSSIVSAIDKHQNVRDHSFGQRSTTIFLSM
jgi:hypothetical protein